MIAWSTKRTARPHVLSLLLSFFVGVLLLAASSVHSLPQPSPVSPTLIWSAPSVRTVYGVVDGYSAFGVNYYLGIPYAAPPIGSLRFKPPVPPQPWDEPRPAYLPGAVCPQQLEGELWMGEEDCLTVNVYSPANVTASSRLPVLVWLYGGAFVFGDGYEFGLYDATNLVLAHGYIAVTLNYRLAALGFLTLDSLRLQSPTNSSGNAAIWDQLAALEWVRDNIAAFGGDPNAVTLAGESAGAMSVCIHLASRYSRGLFRGAIMESGTCDSDTFFVPYAASVQWSTLFANSVGCAGNDSNAMLACMQKLPVDKLLQPTAINASTAQPAASAIPTVARLAPFELHRLPNTLKTVQQLYAHTIPISTLAVSIGTVSPTPLPLLYPTIPWTPTIDSALLLDTPLSSIQKGDWSRVPVLYSILPGGAIHDPLIASDLPVILAHMLGGANNSQLIAAVLAAYPIDAFPTVNNLTEAILRDYVFACPSRRLAAAVSGSGNGSVWLYEFDYVGTWVEDSSLGVYHSSELEFVFANSWPPLVHPFSQRDLTMASTIGAYWTNLIRAADVNEGGEHTPLQWVRWRAADKSSLRLDVPVRAETAIHSAVCDLWDSVAAIHRTRPQPLPTHSSDGRRTDDVRIE